ncbi:MAG: hypothetical protein WD844_04745 [Thermoleophilaceae bacterium]
MADRLTIMAGVWDRLVEEWNAGNVEKARSLERFYTALEARFAGEGTRRPRAAAPDGER